MNKIDNNKPHYMDEYYKTRKNLSLKYVNMPLDTMKAEIKKSSDKCILRIEKVRADKMASMK